MSSLNGSRLSVTLSAVHVTVAGAVLYAVGFLVANQHFGVYAPFQGDVLGARYLAAAVWFLVWQLLPLGSALVTLDVSAKRARAAIAADPNCFPGRVLTEIPDLVRGFRDYADSVGVALILHVVGLAPLQLGDAARQFLAGATSFGVSFVVFVIFLRVFFPIREPTGGENQVRAGSLSGVTYVLGWLFVPLLVLVGMFGWWSYPRLKASVGGGAAWLADVTVEAPRLPHRRLEAGQHRVVLADFASEYATLVLCDSGQRRPVSITVPRTQVTQVVLLEQVRLSPNGLQTLLCDTSRAEPSGDR